MQAMRRLRWMEIARKAPIRQGQYGMRAAAVWSLPKVVPNNARHVRLITTIASDLLVGAGF